MSNQKATIKATGQKVTIANFSEETINYPKKTVVVSNFFVKCEFGYQVTNFDKNGKPCAFFTKDELEFEPLKPKLTKDEILWRETQAENQEKSEDYNLAAFESYFK